MKKTHLAVIAAIGIGWLSGCNKALHSLPSPLYGNDQRNGGDNLPPDDGALWFAGKRTIRLCLARDPAFPIGTEEVKATIQRAFGTWKEYFERRVLTGPGAIAFGNVANAPSFEYVLTDRCDHSEDLKIYLGGSDEGVEKARAGFSDPTAFAHRTAYDSKTAWGKGFIWVAPSGPGFPWTAKPNLLLAILLHELGHVLGCEHVEGTIMTARIGKLLQSGAVASPAMAEPYLTAIDGNKALVLNPTATEQIQGFGNADTCQALIGRACRGSVRGVLTSGTSPRIALSDDVGSFEIPVSLHADSARFTSEARLFTLYRTGDSPVHYWIAGGGGSVEYGTAPTREGTVDVVVERNTDAPSAGRLRVRVRHGGGLRDLFSAFRHVW